ncbi:MetQ/NlpA family ABC transporter substrate-binding protein [Nocardiopsis sp. NPDC007018]|uniref:MetQ/NlpA family ABC transporter substrate-binding protein n=1 Tax=Nocardiopsis sp. NPDC007018 TaxID=3155721 RepID=UPI0033D76C32
MSTTERSSLYPHGASALAAASALALALTGCGPDRGDGGSSGAEGEPFRIGVVGVNETHRLLAQLAEEELGHEVELVNFTDYNQPNPALANGDLDANWFQHIAYLADYNAASGDDLTPIGPTEIVPLSLYSADYEAVDDFREGDEIAVPNDAVNQGRAINVLAQAGLVELREDTPQPQPRDVDEDASTVTVTPLSAEQTVNALQSVQGAVINNSFLNDAGIDPKSALFGDDPGDPAAFPFVNAFVVRAEDGDNEALAAIAALYHDDRVLEIASELSEGTSVPADVDVDELRTALSDYQAAIGDGE